MIEQDTDLVELMRLRSTRRRLFRRGTHLAAGAAAAATLGIAAPTPAMAAGDADVLNFALNLEYLEAEFYLRAAFGRGLAEADTTGQGALGPVTGGSQVKFGNKYLQAYAEEIAMDEEAHVKFLRSALGSAAVARPAIDLDQSFLTLAAAAKLKKAEKFDPFRNHKDFLLGAFVFEDVGVTAYHGAATLIQTQAYLAAATGILAVEAYHAAEIRTLLLGMKLDEEANQISDVRDAVDGTSDDDQGITLGGVPNIVPADQNGIAFSRTTSQVLSIVYLGGTGSGGFFPMGLNGAVR